MVGPGRKVLVVVIAALVHWALEFLSHIRV